jgi:hypothetical protein
MQTRSVNPRYRSKDVRSDIDQTEFNGQDDGFDVRAYARDGHAFGSVETAVRQRAKGEVIRFTAPKAASREQIDSLKSLGAIPT